MKQGMLAELSSLQKHEMTLILLNLWEQDFMLQELMMNSSFMGVGSQVVVWLCLWNMTILKLSNKYIVYH